MRTGTRGGENTIVSFTTPVCPALLSPCTKRGKGKRRWKAGEEDGKVKMGTAIEREHGGKNQQEGTEGNSTEVESEKRTQQCRSPCSVTAHVKYWPAEADAMPVSAVYNRGGG